MKKLLSLLFLDIDGVLTINEEDNMDQIIPLLQARGYTVTDEVPCLIYDQVILELFDETAVRNLELLITEAETMLQHEIGIVLSSDWRLNRHVPFLQKLFQRFSFSQYIVDRTPQLLNASREEEIMYWLKDKSLVYLSEPSSPAHRLPLFIPPDPIPPPLLSLEHGGISREEYDIHSFVIIDDHDSAFSNHFPDQFVHVHQLFSHEDCLKALQILRESYTTSEKAMETIINFQSESYTISEETYESLDTLR